MTGAPRVTVVLIVYNGEKFLTEAIKSVRSQTLADWELVAVDDGSTDRTADILAEFAAILPGRMRIVRHPGGVNRGMSASRNLGIQESRSAYVSFLDHDDVLRPDKLIAHVAALDAHREAAVVIGPNLRWYSWADPSCADQVQDLGVPCGILVAPPGPLPVFLERTCAVPLGFTVRRSELDAVGGFEDSFEGMYEDQVLLTKLCLRYSVYVAESVDHWYRQHPASMVRKTFGAGAQLLARRRFLWWMRDYLREHASGDGRLNMLVRQELARTRFARWHWISRQVRRSLAGLARLLWRRG